ncbi:MAG: Rpn family recombination-promoting nuclease/putative transposase [Alphaproteobacteria bacterium]|nr:Rpn family recombination-promoting nuclease/putative transposase [Alphaproteobacteria bacterium]
MTKNHIASPHDRFVRAIMTNPKVIQEFFETNLPQEVKDLIDFSSITPEKESFINDKLRLQIADILFSVEFQGEPGYLYLLLEHASSPDKMLPFRMLKYMISILDHHLIKTNTQKLPLIYPLVLYTGKTRFIHSMDLFELFGSQKALAKTIFTNPYHLVDLTQVSDEALKQHLWFGAAALVAKHIRDQDILPTLREVVRILKALEEKGEEGYIYTVISYVVEAGEVLDKDAFVETLTQGLASLNEERIMSILEQFKPEIYNRGIEKGKLEALHDVAFNLLDLGVSLEQINQATGLSVEEIKTLKRQLN